MNKFLLTTVVTLLGGAALLAFAFAAIPDSNSYVRPQPFPAKIEPQKTSQVPVPLLNLVETPAVKIGPVEKAEVVILGASNTVVLRGPVTIENVSELQRKILKMSQALGPSDYIYLVLDTPGGSISAGNNLIDTVKALPQKVKTLTIFAASMGFQIAQNLDERLVVPHGTLMSHQATFGGIGGEVSSDGTGQLISRLKWNLRDIQIMDVHAAERMGLELSAYQQLIKPEYWVDGQDAVDAKAADRVVLASCSTELLEGTNIQTVTTPFGPLELQFSNCPLISYPTAIGKEGLTFNSPIQEFEFNQFLKTLFEDKEAFVHQFIITNAYTKFLK